jgi:hypothetical protein
MPQFSRLNKFAETYGRISSSSLTDIMVTGRIHDPAGNSFSNVSFA